MTHVSLFYGLCKQPPFFKNKWTIYILPSFLLFMVYIHDTHFLSINGTHIYDPLSFILWIIYISPTFNQIMVYIHILHEARDNGLYT